jgi:hypothetical protein
MKRIGEIAARLDANPIELVAAANQKRSTEFTPDTQGRLEAEPSVERARNRNREETERAIALPEGVASEFDEAKMTPAPIGEAAGVKKGPKRRGGNGVLTSRRETTPDTMSGSMMVAPPTSRFPRRSATVIDLHMERERRHAALANSPKRLAASSA